MQLGKYFADHDFTGEVKDSLFSIVSAAISIYYRMLTYMRPTPTKSHYTYNCRDLSHVSTASSLTNVTSSCCADVNMHVAGGSRNDAGEFVRYL